MFLCTCSASDPFSLHSCSCPLPSFSKFIEFIPTYECGLYYNEEYNEYHDEGELIEREEYERRIWEDSINFGEYERYYLEAERDKPRYAKNR